MTPHTTPGRLLVIGQPVLDHIAHVEIVHQRGTLLKVMDIDAGWIVFQKGSYISTECGSGRRLVFGPFQDFEDDATQLGKEKAIGRRFRAGEKVSIPEDKVHVVDWREDIERFGLEKVGRLGYVNRSPGGGQPTAATSSVRSFLDCQSALPGFTRRKPMASLRIAYPRLSATRTFTEFRNQCPLTSFWRASLTTA